MRRTSARDVRGAVVGISVFVVITLACTWLMWTTLNNYVSGDTEEFTAEFTDASGLHVGDSVRVAGVKVGRVEEMELAGTLAKVTFSVRTEQRLFSNTRAQLRYQNLTGQRYLALKPGAGKARPLTAGSTIPVQRTDPSLDLTVLLGGLEPLFSVLDPADLNRLADNISGVLHGEGPALRNLLVQAATLMRQFGDRDEVIGAVIDGLPDVLSHLARSSPQFERLIGKSRKLVDGLNAEAGPMFAAVERIGEVSPKVIDLIRDVRPAQEAGIAKFNQVAALFLRERGAVEGTIRGLPRFLAGAGRVTQHGSWMNLYACRIDIEIPGIEPGTVADMMGSKHSEPCR